MSDGILAESLATRTGRLFEAYRHGDEAAMAELVRVVTPLLWHTVRATRLDAATVEDVLQTTWIALVRNADSITEPAAVLQWLIVTSKREAWRVSRLQTRVRPEDLEQTTLVEQAATDQVEDDVVRGDTADRLWRHVESLPARCRTLLRVIAFADRPDYAGLAKSLGMPLGSIGPTRGRCLAKLKLALAADPAWEPAR